MRVAILAVMLAASLPLAAADKPLRFGRDVLPILSANCFSCHGPDESQRKAGLRLDLESEAKRAYAGGVPVAAGNLFGSLLVQRITSTDPDLLMPPPGSHRTLTDAQKSILQQWISEGAVWGRYWSFESPMVTPGVPSASAGIDRLVEMSLSEHGLQLGPAADRYTLIRRLSLDLTGLPPAVSEAEAFVGSSDPRAVEQLVDALLACEEFGEHWARMRLDLARYAYTKGYEKDLGRTMWPWRDWLVKSLNQDLPLDVLTEHLLAGDLLPAADDQQRLATAFHRNTKSNDEGGTDDEEYRSIAVKDRVDTTVQVWMGLTAGCAKCHSHKYDPISMTDYYGLHAIFNQTEDADRYDDAPTLELLDEEQRRNRSDLRTRQADLRRRLEQLRLADAAGDDQGWRVLSLQRAESLGGAMLKSQADGSIVVSGVRPAEDVYTLVLDLPAGLITALRLQALPGSGADIAGVVDRACVIRTMQTEQFNHAPSQLFLHTGTARLGNPSLGSWVTWGLGSLNENLPGFVVLLSGGKTLDAGKSLWGSGFLPSVYQGVNRRASGDPVLYLSDPAGIDCRTRRRMLDSLAELNASEFARSGDSETQTRISQYELAHRMQAAVPRVIDLSGEPKHIPEMYGAQPGYTSPAESADDPRVLYRGDDPTFANNCLLARRLVENGVRFVQLYDWGWDHHGSSPRESIDETLPIKCQASERAIAALIRDLEQRGLLDETLIVWSGEFGRTPMMQNNVRTELQKGFVGRDHHPYAFTMWLAGGGIRGGLAWGSTDEFGYYPVEHPATIRDLQATILHVLGLDPQRFSYFYQGLQNRLIGPTDEARILDSLLV